MRIFLSSTALDLSEVRENILKLLSVIPADLVRMETFGSDEAHSLEYSLQQVRSCNLFIGVYAERYGTIDLATGRSITELEYREAFKMYKEGRLSGLLIYILDGTADWRIDRVDRDPDKVLALGALKKDLTSNHTVTYFKGVEELSLNVLRDVLRKVGIGHAAALKAKTDFADPVPNPAEPIGMEHYTERDARWLRGRGASIAAVCDLIEKNPQTLLIGDSGIGKTSMVQAGIFPVLRMKGWITAYCRPLDSPDESIPSAVWHQLMEGAPPDQTILTTFNLISEAHRERHVLIAIDQLEDIIPQLGSSKTSNLLHALAQVHSSPPPNLHLLLSYRGDTEPKVGHYWQLISGSASGLPRYYLGALSRDAAAEVLLDVLAPIMRGPGGDVLVEQVISETEAESMRSLGVEIYPPFLQMIAETLFKSARASGGFIESSLYQSLGGARQIIGRYLLNQLRMLGPRRKECQAVMVSLAGRVRRFRKTIEEIARDASISISIAADCVQDLLSLRLVHNLEGRWEIVHDFLAQRVIEDLVAPEEHEARIFRDVVVAKAAAFASTKEHLTYKEHLGIYAHRQRIVLTPNEVELVFASCMDGNGPVGYFLRSIPHELPLSWAEAQVNSPNSTTKQNAYRFMLSSGRGYPLSALVAAFDDYKLQFELASFIRRFSTAEDIPLLMKLRLKKAEQVRASAVDQLARVVEPTNSAVMGKLLRSRNSRDIHLAARILSGESGSNLSDDCHRALRDRKLETRARAICALGMRGDRSDADFLLKRVKSEKLPEKEEAISGYSLSRWAQANNCMGLIEELLLAKNSVCSGALGALESRGGLELDLLLQQYARLPFETSAAVLRIVGKTDQHEIEGFIVQNRLHPPMRNIVAALIRVGGMNALRWILELIGRQEHLVEFWNVPALVIEIGKIAIDAESKLWLSKLAESDEFWRYTWDQRSQVPLPVRIKENLYLFKRLAGVALASACSKDDWPLLKRLVFHDYWTIQVAAAERIVKFGSVDQLNALVEQARLNAKESPDHGVVYTLSLLDATLFALAD